MTRDKIMVMTVKDWGCNRTTCIRPRPYTFFQRIFPSWISFWTGRRLTPTMGARM